VEKRHGKFAESNQVCTESIEYIGSTDHLVKLSQLLQVTAAPFFLVSYFSMIRNRMKIANNDNNGRVLNLSTWVSSENC
jgi:hypothetical protein